MGRIKKISTLAALGAMAVVAFNSLLPATAASDFIDEHCWQPSFSDEFNDLDLWDAESGTGQWKTSYIWERDAIINNELQYYIDPKLHGMNPFSINDGVLSITAQKTPEHLLGAVKNQPYISGVLTTEKGFSQKYGRFEANVKVPKGKGFWSAFWLLPSFDRWPEGVAILPEIDVLENLGHENSTFHTTLHTNQNGKLESHPYDHTVRSDLTRGFHLYSVVWSPETVDWYFDKKKVASHPTPADYTRPVHFLLNLAVGGTWPGSPDNSTRFPASYEVDYVRAYTKLSEC